MKKYILLFLLVSNLMAQKILIPMDQSQTNHLKSYGITYWVLKQGLRNTDLPIAGPSGANLGS